MTHKPAPRAWRLAAVVLGLAAAGSPPFRLEAAQQGEPRVLQRAWTVDGAAVGSPATADSSAYFLSKSHEVLAIDAASGHIRWRQPTNESGYGGTGSSVVVSGSVVVAGDYNLLAFDRRSGVLRWRFVPTDGYGPGFYLSFSATADGVVYAGSPSGRFYAVDAESGRLRWSTVVAADGKTTVFPPRFQGTVVAAGFTEFVAPNRGGLVVLDTRTGRILWKRAFPQPSDRSLSVNWAGGPVFANDLVIASSGDGVVHAFDTASGEERWAIPALSGRIGNPIISPDRDFRGLAVSGQLLVSGSLTGTIVAYDLATRTERWRHLAERLGSVMFRIEASNEVVYVPFAGGTLVALRADDGIEQWRVGDWMASLLWPPAFWNDLIIVSGAVDGFSAFRRITD